MDTILLTGATGYLGGYLSEFFLKKGYKIIALALNEKDFYKYNSNENVKVYYLDKNTISEIFEKENVDIVIHTATLYGRRQEQLADMVKVNVEFPVTVLTEAVKHNVKMFINTDTILAKNINAYSLTKSQFADWLGMFASQIKAVDIKLDHFYGPNDNPVKFVAWVIKQLKENVDKIDLTEGSQTRDFIYIDDVVSAFATIVENKDKILCGKLNVFEVGTNNKTSIRDMVSNLKTQIGNTTTKLNFGAIPYRKNEVLDYNIDTSKLNLLGWIPKYKSIEQGVKKLLEIEGAVK